jgi:hypothetical protein
MRRALIIALACAATVALAAGPANADTAPQGTSYASAVNVTPGTGIVASIGTNGDIAGLLDFLTPVLDQFVTPVSSALNDLPTTMSSDLAADLDATYVANSSGSAVSAPTDGSFPDCTGDGWGSDNCYASDTVTSAVNPVVDLNAASVRGYAAADSTGSTSGARTGGVTLSALGVDVGSLGTATSSATCTVSGTCNTTGSFTDASLLDGTVTAQSAPDGSVLVSISGGDYEPVSALTGPVSVTDGDTTATVQPAGDALEVSIPMTLDQLLAGLGVTDDLADLGAYDAGSNITLDVILGGQDAQSSTTRGSGLRVGVGVNADVEVSVFGLIGASIEAADTSSGNAADLQLAFTTATAPDEGSDAPVQQTNLK